MRFHRSVVWTAKTDAQTGKRYYEKTSTKLTKHTLSGVSWPDFKNSVMVVAWRVLDAQFVRVDSHPRAVPQRRRRVFVVGHLGDWRPSVAVLLEPESLRGNPPPRREAGQDVAGSLTQGFGSGGARPDDAGGLVSGTLSSRPNGSGGLGTDFDCGGGLITPPLTGRPYADNESREGLLVSAFGGGNREPVDVATTRSARGQRLDFESDTFVTHTLRGDGHDASEDGTGRGTPIVPFDTTQITSPENRSHLRAGQHDGSHANSGAPPAVAFQSKASAHQSMNPSECAPTLYVGKADGLAVAVLEQRGRDGETTMETRSDGTANALRVANGGRAGTGIGAVHYGMTVRRLTPLECERLQGFPDDHTAVPHRGKPMADGPRYRMLGNSMAINVLTWIGQRIALFEKVTG